ncbi:MULTISPECIES: hypothetical protein [Mycobacterium]|uniref:hypothetical protein n=1 Tax=Mycobacterium TaxID=1763 RepID=UPI001CD9C00D|nr:MULTISPECIES: hypothetical protein [Mycobacterium]MCA2243091.1 hypothetical protein [Mycobacterium sp. WUMAC-067]MCA2314038.1 hypothetical protein [Mycobacterium sp. WUMAC-025]MEE3753819.1 hypothetical protein [Mycobacterium intracellulare]
MIALEYHDNCCGLADPLTPLAAAALPDDVPASSAGELPQGENVDGVDAHTVFDGHRPDYWTVGRPGLRDIEVCIESARADGAISLGLVVNGLDCSGLPIDQALSLADARGDAGVCGVSCRGGGHLKAS